MELDEMKGAWALLEKRVEAAEMELSRDRSSRERNRVEHLLLGLTAGQAVHVVVWIVVVAMIGPFWIEHRRIPHFLIAGLTLHVYGVAVIWASVLQMAVIGRVYYTKPVVQYQQRVAELQRLRAVIGLALGLPWWILWIPATMVGAKKFRDVDLWAQSPAWINVALVAGLAGAAMSLWAARRVATSPSGSKLRNRIVETLSGRSLACAARRIDEIANFERD